MSTYINQAFSLANGESVTIFVDRWSAPLFSVAVTAGSAAIEGTLDRINRGETPTWYILDDSAGAALSALTAHANLEAGPLEAIRITATGNTTGRLMQIGTGSR